MNASQYSRFPARPPQHSSRSQRATRKSSPKSSRRTVNNPPVEIAVETSVKLVVNVLMCGIAVSALTQLLPYLFSGRERLQVLETELARTETRVERLRDRFGIYFDPQQTKTIMQAESNLTDPAQLRIIWVDTPDEERQETD